MALRDKQVLIRVSQEERAKIEAEAAEKGVSLSDIVRFQLLKPDIHPVNLAAAEQIAEQYPGHTAETVINSMLAYWLAEREAEEVVGLEMRPATVDLLFSTSPPQTDFGMLRTRLAMTLARGLERRKVERLLDQEKAYGLAQEEADWLKEHGITAKLRIRKE
mgnify:CR=1 FL=1